MNLRLGLYTFGVMLTLALCAGPAGAGESAERTLTHEEQPAAGATVRLDNLLGSIQVMHMVWRELRRQSGCASKEPPMRVRRIARRLADHKCSAYLRENPG